ncbi:MAG: hypothetical protein M3R51_05305, partial [Candidatus Eremiobacteraeota bacterium]|nr:hypothetical protein [Candidatus Eremiobacteraeota bacterium]
MDAITATGTVESIATNIFSLQTGLPHGMIDVHTGSGTKFIGGSLAVGDHVVVVGTGSWGTYIVALTVTIGSGTPAPSSSPSFPPNGPNNATMMLTPAGKFGLMQVFDEYNSNLITSSQGSADGPRYGVVWGARPGMPPYWRAHTSSLVVGYYMPQETDQSYDGWGNAGHDLTWWKANHPDWILYACTSSGTPTTTPAYLSQLPYNVPLDVHNPEVVTYQIENAGNYAVANGYNGLSVDQVV